MPLITLLEIGEYTGLGYRPVADYGAWRVAILRYIDELRADQIDSMQRHDETDEVFVLLAGHCLLFLSESDERTAEIHAVDMQPCKTYNVKRGAWHTHTLTSEAVVLIVENRNTADSNSPHMALSEAQRRQIVDLTRKLWK